MTDPITGRPLKEPIYIEEKGWYEREVVEVCLKASELLENSTAEFAPKSLVEFERQVVKMELIEEIPEVLSGKMRALWIADAIALKAKSFMVSAPPDGP